MVGTRLVVHATLVVELLVLIAASFFYASGRRHDPYLSAEPFLPDRSGWRLLVEDVSPAPSHSEDASSLGYVVEYATAAISKIRSLVGLQTEGGGDAQHDTMLRMRRVSAFVQEMRMKVAGFQFAGEDNHRDLTVPTGILPRLKVVLQIPQIKSSPMLNSLAEALERGFLGQSMQSPDFPLVKLLLADRRYDYADMVACDDYNLPVQSELISSYREVKHPEILVLFGCTGVTIPDEHTTSVEVSSSSDVIVVRTTLAIEQSDQLRSYLEEYASREILSRIFFATYRRECRLGSVSVDLVDENPASHIDDGSSSASKSRFDIIGRALSSSVRSTIGPLVGDLSFVYGGKIAVGWGGATEFGDENNVIMTEVAIDLEAHSSAYASLSDLVVKEDASDDYQSNVTNSVSSQSLADWAYAHSRQPIRYAQTGLDCRDDVRWTLLIPSQENSPLRLRDESSGKYGESMIFSSSKSIGGRSNIYPNGVSIINLSKFSQYFESNVEKLDLNLPSYQRYKDMISASLVHLVGYLRAIHGLTASVISKNANEQGLRAVSFWELEAIGRSHFYPTLETAFHEADALFAVLRQHGRHLALPEDVAHRLNNATHLLRQSIHLVEQGYPMMYATSLLHGSLRHLESVKIDHRMIEVPYFAPDHYLAVFSPLILPLLLPMMSGLIREVKRFQKLREGRYRT
ncbi:hypothetical protein ACHAXA_006975 [Cyclostephanos tholiformis]|uniref:GPI transamidase component PIG-S n=1 Tax=Cyclostephanos tholiformis TaxID=382380 RepID=A0ABD3RXD6_9STRA